eukprot:GAHX01000392.1.p1 GENE.GAHX01000392.1~~GAHX01000392.1.p1  ORF type:complete len:202 (-),score=48.68 GAHX01000392.1:30-635(-)
MSAESHGLFLRLNYDNLFEDINKLTEFMMSLPGANDFNLAVPWEDLGLPDYPEKIKKPMDLGTVAKNLENQKYKTPDDCIEDMRLVFNNAITYNQPGSSMHLVASFLSSLLEKKIEILLRKGNSENYLASKDSGLLRKIERLKEMTAEFDKKEISTLVNIIEEHCPVSLTLIDKKSIDIEYNDLNHKTLDLIENRLYNTSK